MKKILTIIFSILILFSYSPGKKSTAIKVELKNENGVYQLGRVGKPHYIKGAGCEFGNNQSIVSFGANAILALGH